MIETEAMLADLDALAEDVQQGMLVPRCCFKNNNNNNNNETTIPKN